MTDMYVEIFEEANNAQLKALITYFSQRAQYKVS